MATRKAKKDVIIITDWNDVLCPNCHTNNHTVIHESDSVVLFWCGDCQMEFLLDNADWKEAPDA